MSVTGAGCPEYSRLLPKGRRHDAPATTVTAVISGHVFVIQGAMAHLDCDAVVVSTDSRFSVRGHWSDTLGTGLLNDERRHADADALRPERWTERRFGRAREPEPGVSPPRPTWLLDVVPDGDVASVHGIAGVMKRLEHVLRDVAGATIRPEHQRFVPLVALPVVGVRGGGLGSLRGSVAELQLEVCERLSHELGLDVVIVTTSPSDYTAFQSRRRARLDQRHPQAADDEAARRLAEARELGSLARRGGLALFIGAGVSMSAGLPAWGDLITHLKNRAAEVEHGIGAFELDDWSDLDKAELLRGVLGERFGTVVAEKVRAERYGVSHAILAALGCREVVTTNFDDLYEKAASDVGGGAAVSVMPHGHLPVTGPWLLKMHGSASEPNSIVLSRSDFVGFDAKSGPMGSILQSLMMTRHLLILGASMTDDNVLRLALEVIAFTSNATTKTPDPAAAHPSRLERKAGSELGTVVTLGPDAARAQLWKGRFRYVSASDEKDLNKAVRDLAIFLDTVAVYAAGTSHLVDGRYANLHPQPEANAIARQARDLLRRVEDLPDELQGTWMPLAEALRNLGAAEEHDDATSSGSKKPT